MKRGDKRRSPGFSLVELLCWLAVIVVCLAMTMPALRSFNETSLLKVEASGLQFWLEGEMARADRSSRSRAIFLVHSRLLKAQYDARPYEEEEYQLGEGWHVVMARTTGHALPSVVYRPVVHTVTPAFTLTMRRENENARAMRIVVSGRSALRTEEVRSNGP